LLGIVLVADALYRATRQVVPLVLRISSSLVCRALDSAVPIGDSKIVQLYTLVLVALGVYEYGGVARFGEAAEDQGRFGVGSGRKP